MDRFATFSTEPKIEISKRNAGCYLVHFDAKTYLVEKRDGVNSWALYVADTVDPDYMGLWSWSDDYSTKKAALENIKNR